MQTIDSSYMWPGYPLLGYDETSTTHAGYGFAQESSPFLITSLMEEVQYSSPYKATYAAGSLRHTSQNNPPHIMCNDAIGCQTPCPLSFALPPRSKYRLCFPVHMRRNYRQ